MPRCRKRKGSIRAFAVGLLLLWSAMRAVPAAAVDRSLGADVAKPAATGAPWTPDAARRLGHDLDALLDAAPTLHGAHVGLLVLDTRSGASIYARNAADAFQPASTLKLLTGSAALATLGPNYRFRTEAWLDPANAALFIRAGGDPLLRATDLDAMARAVRSADGTTLRVGVRVDATEFESAPYPPGWAWDDLAYDYAAVVSAAAVEENVVHILVSPGARVGAPAAVTSGPPPFDARAQAPGEGCAQTRAFRVIGRATTSAARTDDTLDVVRERGGDCIVVTGSLPLGNPPETIDAAVPDPVAYLRELATHALVASGITAPVTSGLEQADVAQAVSPGSRLVWTNEGEPLTDLLADMWWPSDNLAAELVLRAIGRAHSGVPGTTEHGADAERAWLTSIGIDPATVTIADGSGLSTYDRITPRALTAVLQADWNGPYRDAVLDDLPLAGVRGTLQHDFIGTPAERRTFAKTGSLNHTRGLAGYLATVHHGALTFAWSVDDWMGTQADLDALRAAVLSRLIGD